MRLIAHIAEVDPCITTQMQNWIKVTHFLNTNPYHAYKATHHYLNKLKAYISLKHQSKQDVILSYWIDPSLIEPIITTNTSQMKTKKKRRCSSLFTNPHFLLFFSTSYTRKQTLTSKHNQNDIGDEVCSWKGWPPPHKERPLKLTNVLEGYNVSAVLHSSSSTNSSTTMTRYSHFSFLKMHEDLSIPLTPFQYGNTSTTRNGIVKKRYRSEIPPSKKPPLHSKCNSLSR